MIPDINRRAALALALTAGTALAAGCASAAPLSPSAASPSLQPLPLPFDPTSIPGVSEKLLTSHHANNYGGAVSRLNAINAQLEQIDPASAAGFMLNGLKREELLAMNSMILHETYFASFGPYGSQPASVLAERIETDFGSLQNWRNEFSAMGKALGGGSGWVLLAWSPRRGRLVNQWAFDHTMTIADGRILLALDMYEHAYHMDYGAKAGAYVDAFMAALSWTQANASYMLATPV
jgi:Fe-Mn family superoxide dismutase